VNTRVGSSQAVPGLAAEGLPEDTGYPWKFNARCQSLSSMGVGVRDFHSYQFTFLLKFGLVATGQAARFLVDHPSIRSGGTILSRKRVHIHPCPVRAGMNSV